MSKVTPIELKDQLVRDALAGNEGQGGGREAEEFIRPILEHWDRKKSEANTVRNTRGSKQEQFAEVAEAEGIKGHVQRLEGAGLVHPKLVEDHGTKMLRKRIHWMKSKPEYNTKMQNIWALLKVKKLTAKQAEGMLWELIGRSDEQLKCPWWKEEQRITVSG